MSNQTLDIEVSAQRKTMPILAKSVKKEELGQTQNSLSYLTIIWPEMKEEKFRMRSNCIKLCGERKISSVYGMWLGVNLVVVVLHYANIFTYYKKLQYVKMRLTKYLE